MPAKKINVESLITLELQKFEQKLDQFQQYLEQNSIVTQVFADGEVALSVASQDMLHKEIVIQIKMQDAVLNWLPLLEKLKAGDKIKKQEIRGGGNMGGLYKKQMGDA